MWWVSTVQVLLYEMWVVSSQVAGRAGAQRSISEILKDENDAILVLN